MMGKGPFAYFLKIVKTPYPKFKNKGFAYMQSVAQLLYDRGLPDRGGYRISARGGQDF